MIDCHERGEIQGRIGTLLGKTAKGSSGHEDRAKIVHVGLELGPLVGEQFARQMLDQALPIFNALPEPADDSVVEERRRLEKALFTWRTSAARNTFAL